MAALLMRTFLLTSLSMLAFAGNSLLCRIALKYTGIDPASFTAVRLVSGALVLWLLVNLRHDTRSGHGNWGSALALFVYAAGFSFAYVSLSAATGALLLFGAVQATMIGHGIVNGERMRGWQWPGLLLALAGLVGLVMPGLSAPPLTGSVLMVLAGIAWGVYSLRGRAGGAPIKVTAGNFLRAAPMAVVLYLLHAALLHSDRTTFDATGLIYAVCSGALASGVGYAIWYTALPALRATTAATVQLSVPVIAALGGIVFLAEPLSLRLVLTSLAILGGIAMVIVQKQHPAATAQHVAGRAAKT